MSLISGDGEGRNHLETLSFFISLVLFFFNPMRRFFSPFLGSSSIQESHTREFHKLSTYSNHLIKYKLRAPHRGSFLISIHSSSSTETGRWWPTALPSLVTFIRRRGDCGWLFPGPLYPDYDAMQDVNCFIMSVAWLDASRFALVLLLLLLLLPLGFTFNITVERVLNTHLF